MTGIRSNLGRAFAAAGLAAILPALCSAEITNVRVSGTTPTQVILSYTAPDSEACSIEVSESATYAPLVHDVDPGLFPEANSDNRPGSIVSGRSRLVVIGKHGMTANEGGNPFLAANGNRYSRALQADTTHYYRIACGPDTATGTFTTRNIPLGSNYPEPLPADSTNPGTYNWPTVTDNSDRSEAFVDPTTGALIRKVSLGSETSSSNANSWPSGGMFQLCSHRMVEADGHTYVLCYIPASVRPTLYSIETDTGNVYALTRIYIRYSSFGCTSTSGPYGTIGFSAADALRIYFTTRSCGSNDGTRVFTARWTGPLNVSNPVGPDDTPPLSASLAITLLTPTKLETLLQQFDSTYDAVQQAQLRYIRLNGIQNGHLLFDAVSQQDSMGWVFVFDPGNHLPLDQGGTGGIIAANPFWKRPVSRWCSMHTAMPAGDSNPWINVVSNNPGRAANTYMGGSYFVSVANNPGTGNLIQIAPTNGSYEPQSTSEPTYLQDAEIGDLFWMNPSSGSGPPEPLEIVAKDPVSHTWTVIRGNNLGSSRFVQGSNVTPASRTPLDITAGTKLYAGCRAATFAPSVFGNKVWYWNYINDPYGTSIVYPAANGTTSNQVIENTGNGGHTVIRDATVVMEATLDSHIAGWWRWIYPNSTPGFDLVSSFTTAEANVPFAGFRGPGGNLNYTTHPSFDQLRAPTPDLDWIVDALPLDDGRNYPAKGTLLSGQTATYRMTGAVLHRKHLTTFASCGLRPLADISGTGSEISDQTPYTYCVAEAAGECQAGSNAGDVFVNCPGATTTTCHSAQATTRVTDICIGDSWTYGGGIVQVGMGSDYRNGASGRMISHLFTTHHGESRYKNVRPTPDARWLLFSTYPALASGTTATYMAKLPPFPSIQSNGESFVPLSITLPGLAIRVNR